MTTTKEEASTSGVSAEEHAVQAGNFSMLTLLIPEADPMEEAKTKVVEISRVMWCINEWQQGYEEYGVSLADYLKKYTTLKGKMMKQICGAVTVSMLEPEIIKVVNSLLYE